jgi:hypothetical protein
MSLRARLAYVARTEVVGGGLDRSDAATFVEKEYPSVAKGILPD